MKILNGLSQVRLLPEKKQQHFERFYHAQVKYRLLPLFADLSLLVTILGTLLFIFSLSRQADTNVHFLTYVYTGILVGLALLHRFTRLRYASPLIVYIVFSLMSLFSYLGYIDAAGGVVPIFGLHFFLSSLGFITLSLFHTLVIIALNLVLLVLATRLAVTPGEVAGAIASVLSNWFIAMCLMIAPLSAIFNRWFFRNLFALQYLLKDRNKLLTATFQSLQETEDKLIQQQKQQALSHMAKGLLHEIMNPVNCSTQALQYARSINRDEEIGEALDDAILHQSRIADIVSDLIEFSQPKPDHDMEQADVRELINTAIRICRNELRGVEVRVSLADNLSVSCYPSALTQVFVNLMLNASSALEGKPVNQAAMIDISSEQGTDSLNIRIRDNGRGIESNDIRRLTEPFYSTKDTPNSLGLGLSICQTIMRHHHGSIKIDSEHGVWTEVVLSLPLRSTVEAKSDIGLSG
ncbi:ATP-binding protein [Hahella sp. CCB-MM4]|uniref:sensor histidine kinase n=1 Tax=Hahella sp. (strain CCB-MM4) TaxID=1926491 RepID=UPI000B9AD546|nr:HAMP domain-containing sensor histidine kinase [Hahella sp. CCB-MM4]OZG71730.1 ATP-binding protein [Hahella sp. CCB-MM4]